MGDRDSCAVCRVLVVDAQMLYCESLCGLVSRWPEFEIAASVSTGEEAVEFCKSHEVDLLLTEIRLPGLDGISAAAAIHRVSPRTTLVVLTVDDSEESVIRAIAQGVHGYLLKDIPARALRDRLRLILQGEGVIAPSVTPLVMKRLRSLLSESEEPVRTVGAADCLTAREREVLKAVSRGLSNEEIGAELYMSVGTVKKQLVSIMQKLRLQNRVQAAVYAVRMGIAD